MKQVLQDFKTGKLSVEDVPAPLVQPGFILVRNHYSVISSGTESGTVKLGKMNLLGKAKARPDQVRKVLQVVRSDGPLTAYQAAMRSLDMPIALGYSSAGEVIDIGDGITDLSIGDLVACGGQGYASHAEVVCVPRNLCVKLPQGTDMRSAAFTTIGSIAMQGIRIASVSLGENIVVIGLGLVGLLTIQLLKAAGCNGFGIDVDSRRTDFALKNHICKTALSSDINLLDTVKAFTNGYGADAVIVTAPTENNDPVALAGEVCRRKGRVVVLGRTKMEAPRETYLYKELQLNTSMAYGPGTGDPTYELSGIDYPIGYVRWTENRNMESFVQLVADNKIMLEQLVTHEFNIEEAARAFDIVTNSPNELSVAVTLKYPDTDDKKEVDKKSENAPIHPAKKITKRSTRIQNIGVIGAGSHAINEMVPALSKKNVCLHAIASATGVRAHALKKKYGFNYATTSAEEIINDDNVDSVFILTRHNTHAEYTIAALESGKNVFVEKPLAMTFRELEQIIEAQTRSGCRVLVGFNRRYAPMAIKLKKFFANRSQPVYLSYRANVGYRPPEHWLHHPVYGGGVILGEACHFVDFCHWFVGCSPIKISSSKLIGTNNSIIPEDNVNLVMEFSDGSIASISYLSNGSKMYSRERVEVHAGNSSGMVEDFRKLEMVHGMGMTSRNHALIKQNKGFSAMLDDFFDPKGEERLSTIFKQQSLSMFYTLKAVEQIMNLSNNELPEI